MSNHLNTVNRTSLSGFTLIEMMIVITVIAILTAIAIPSYRQYTIKNAESQALAKMKQIETELNAWRATALTYRGFYPRQTDSAGNITFVYSDASNKQIYVPDALHTNYTITLTADRAGTTTLATALSNTPTATTVNLGNTWFMYATPNASLASYGAKKILMSSSGLGCKSSASTFNANSNCDTPDTTSLTK